MRASHTSYLSIVLVLAAGLMLASTGLTAEIFLSPDSVFLHGATGTDVDFTLEVDAATTDLKLFQIRFAIDPAKLDTVMITEGPLLPSSGQVTVFNYFLDQNDSVLTVEGLILGSGVSVAGPGVLADITVKVLDTGTVELAVAEHEMRDVNNDVFASDAAGAVILHEVPPDEFNLLTPTPGETIIGFLGDFVDFQWSPSQSVYAGEGVEYTLEYGPDPGFGGGTVVVAGLTDTSHSVSIADFMDTDYYWRVTATGDTHGYTRASTPASDMFTYQTGQVAPAGFGLLSPADGVEIDVTDSSSVWFDWEDSHSQIVDPSLAYVLRMSLQPAGGPVVTMIPKDTVNDISELSLPKAILTVDSMAYWWDVIAINSLGLQTQATPRYTVAFYSPTPSCCVGETGDVNESGDPPTLTDLTLLVNALFVTFDPVDCRAEANTSGDAACEVTLTDLTLLVNKLFVTFEPTANCTDFDNTACE